MLHLLLLLFVATPSPQMHPWTEWTSTGSAYPGLQLRYRLGSPGTVLFETRNAGNEDIKCLIHFQFVDERTAELTPPQRYEASEWFRSGKVDKYLLDKWTMFKRDYKSEEWRNTVVRLINVSHARISVRRGNDEIIIYPPDAAQKQANDRAEQDRKAAERANALKEAERKANEQAEQSRKRQADAEQDYRKKKEDYEAQRKQQAKQRAEDFEKQKQEERKHAAEEAQKREDARKQRIIDQTNKKIQANNEWVATWQSSFRELSSASSSTNSLYQRALSDIDREFAAKGGSARTMTLREIAVFWAKRAALAARDDAVGRASSRYLTQTSTSGLQRALGGLILSMKDDRSSGFVEKCVREADKYRRMMEESRDADLAIRSSSENSTLFAEIGFKPTSDTVKLSATPAVDGPHTFEGKAEQKLAKFKIEKPANAKPDAKIDVYSVSYYSTSYRVDWQTKPLSKAAHALALFRDSGDTTEDTFSSRVVSGSEGQFRESLGKLQKLTDVGAIQPTESPYVPNASAVRTWKNPRTLFQLGEGNSLAMYLAKQRLVPSRKGASTTRSFGDSSREIVVTLLNSGTLTGVKGCEEKVIHAAFRIGPEDERNGVRYSGAAQHTWNGDVVFGADSLMTYYMSSTASNDNGESTSTTYCVTKLEPTLAAETFPGFRGISDADLAVFYEVNFGLQNVPSQELRDRLIDAYLTMLETSSTQSAADWIAGFVTANPSIELKRSYLSERAIPLLWNTGHKDAAMDLSIRHMTSGNAWQWFWKERFGPTDKNQKPVISFDMARELLEKRYPELTEDILGRWISAHSDAWPKDARAWDYIVGNKLYETDAKSTVLVITYASDHGFKASALLANFEAVVKHASPKSVPANLPFALGVALKNPKDPRFDSVKTDTLASLLTARRELLPGGAELSQATFGLMKILASRPDLSATTFEELVERPDIKGFLGPQEILSLATARIAAVGAEESSVRRLRAILPSLSAPADRKAALRVLTQESPVLAEVDQLAEAAESAGDRLLQEAALRLAISLAPNDAARVNKLVAFVEGSGDSEKLFALLASLHFEAPSPARALRLGEMCLAKGAVEKAREYYEAAKKLGASSPALDARFKPKPPLKKPAPATKAGSSTKSGRKPVKGGKP